MHVIGKRSHPCYTMHVFLSSDAAKTAPSTAALSMGIISASVFVCPQKQPDGVVW